jgi:unsaturated rhamnogalacturonyl hydrolase
MKRRKFVVGVPLAGISLGLSNSIIGRTAEKFSGSKKFKSLSIVEKVKTALLSMQRRTWEQGVAMQVMLELGEEELVILMARDAVMYQSADGRLAMNSSEDGALSDAASPGEAVLWAAKKTGDQKLMEGFNKLLDYIMNEAPRNKDGIIFHFTGGQQVWSDINYMLPPFLAVAGKYEEAIKQYEGACTLLMNKEKKLLIHQWDCEKNISPRTDLWGVGNGWTAAGGARIIKALPDSMKNEKERMIGHVQGIIDAALVYQRPDGLFHDVLDNPNTFIETNFAQMLAYTIYRGVKAGWLNRKYLEKADLIRKAAHGKVDDYGLVQGVCGAPNFDRSSVATEGQAFFILMEVAYKELKS